MKPIETHYRGHRFRSRLEARWAVFFDYIDLRWMFEPQGFVIDDRPYLPDFHLPDLDVWVEVKGDEALLDYGLMERFAQQLRPGAGLLLLGPIPDPGQPGDWDWGWQLLALAFDVDEVFGHWVGFGTVPSTGQLARLTETSSSTPFDDGSYDHWLTPVRNEAGPDASTAYRAARSARFEHGESGYKPTKGDTP